MHAKPKLFTFWHPRDTTPAHIAMCLETQHRNLSEAFDIVELDLDSCRDWVEDFDRMWTLSVPYRLGRSLSMETRHIAQFTGMLRFALLARHGGLWLDADHVAFPNCALLADQVLACDLVAAEDIDAMPTNSVLGARPGSPFMAACHAALQENLARKQATGEGTSRWGENGFRMIRRVWAETPPETAFIAPFGSLITFGWDAVIPRFDHAGAGAEVFSPHAMGFSLINNSVSADDRALTREDHLARNSAFSLAYRHAMGEPTPLAGQVTLATAAQLAPLNRHRFVADRIRETTEAERREEDLRQRLTERNTRIESLRARLDKPEKNDGPGKATGDAGRKARRKKRRAG